MRNSQVLDRFAPARLLRPNCLCATHRQIADRARAWPTLAELGHGCLELFVLLLCYRLAMSVRRKRSISLRPELDAEIEAEAAKDGMTYSGWVANAVSNELKVRAGLAAVAEVEEQIGGFTDEEIAAADEWAQRAIVRRRATSRTPRAA